MTWIKPSFLWMMYRAGWGKKDTKQKRILSIDITREGFEWALAHSCLSHFEPNIYATKEEWLRLKEQSPVRNQWDSERDIHLQPLEHRAIQIGLSEQAVRNYVNNWIQSISDITKITEKTHFFISKGLTKDAELLLPIESEYKITSHLAAKLGIHLNEAD